MARKRCEERDKAKQLFLDSDGTMDNADIAEAVGVASARVRKWKCEDKWNEALKNKPKSRGGQRGNKNAVGHGAPKGNHNAETHGAYRTVNYDELTAEEREVIDSLTLDTATNMLLELRKLIAKEQDLKKRIEEYYVNTGGELYTDKVVEMRTPVPLGEREDMSDPYGSYDEGPAAETKEKLKLTMETTVKSSAFERVMKLEAELNKTHGRIIKLLDSIKSYELERRRIEIEEKRYQLLKQKATGEYEVNVETGEIDDTYESEDDFIDNELGEKVL